VNVLEIAVPHGSPCAITTLATPKECTGNVWLTLHDMIDDVVAIELAVNDFYAC